MANEVIKRDNSKHFYCGICGSRLYKVNTEKIFRLYCPQCKEVRKEKEKPQEGKKEVAEP